MQRNAVPVMVRQVGRANSAATRVVHSPMRTLIKKGQKTEIKQGRVTIRSPKKTPLQPRSALRQREITIKEWQARVEEISSAGSSLDK